ncbi:MAG: hypothetical protein LIO44_01025 [Eubacterium sp.]|nr:hypothetical protein [Eubacterium sp.]
MERIRKYTIDGIELNVPLCYDKRTGTLIEDYNLWLSGDKFTASGYPILVSVEDACKFAESTDSGDCPDCGSCRFYKRAGEHSWIGICSNSKKLKKEKEENP